MFKKELISILRDYRTYIFVLVTPLIEAVFFGLIINHNAIHIPTIVVSHDNSPMTSSLIQAFKNTDYFAIKEVTDDVQHAEELMKKGRVQFVINIPHHFTRDLIRNESPHILLEGDATDPAIVSGAFNTATILTDSSLQGLEKGTLKYLAAPEKSFIIDTHAKYNPAIKAQYHTLPGLLSTILTVSLALVMAISITSEYESGTMEMLLIAPINPLEVIVGKLLPNIFLGYILFFSIIIASTTLFKVPFYGSVFLLSAVAFPFIIANLSFGIATSCISKSQFQAAQIVGSYTLPAILFSGFLFPHAAMPIWAQWISKIFPATYFLKISSDVMLKGSTLMDILPNLWPIVFFSVVFIAISYKFYRKTLD
jgi:ABC-2 type transport system permease protein